MSITFPGFGSKARAMLDAVNRSQAIVQFDLEGKILEANANFCAAFGYELCEIVGRRHRIFVDPDEAASAAYREFWARLARGEFDRRQCRRLGKGGREMWIEASYNPVFRGGRPLRIVAFATDITEAKRRADEDAAKLAAVSRSQAVVEFTPDGEILTANANFCDTLGYSPDEIVGSHHRMFCEPAYAASGEYGRFWLRLGKGEAI
ncbi:PAS domain-containing protein, partial [Rhizobiaceae sp. 2RAB30]